MMKFPSLPSAGLWRLLLGHISPDPNTGLVESGVVVEWGREEVY